MRSYTTLRNLYGSLTNDTASANLTLGDALINDSIRTIAAINGGKWQFLEVVKTKATVASQRAYEIPNSIRKLTDVYMTVGTTIYTPTPIENSDTWKNILAAVRGTSDVTEFVYKQGGQVLFDPIPASSSNTITFRGRKNLRDLSVADYTTGTVTSIANGATTLTASGTTFTDKFVGRFIMIPIAQGGDGLWYEIASRTSNTVIELTKPYEGTTISAATATYTIGEMSVIPESYDIAPVYRAVALYWAKEGEMERAKMYWMMYDGGYEAGLSKSIGGLVASLIEEQGEKFEGNHVSAPMSIDARDPNIPPRDLTGF